MLETNQVFIETFAIIILGFCIKYFNFITEKDGKTISKFLMHSTFPALMFVSTYNVKLEGKLLLIPIFAIILGLLMQLAAWFWFKNYQNSLRGLMMMGVGGFNTGLFGFPIIESLFGKENLVYAIMFDLGNTCIVFGMIYSMGLYFSDTQKTSFGIKNILKKIFTLPPVLAMIAGLLFNLSGLTLPSVGHEILTTLSKANKPLVLLLMGIYLSFELDKKTIISIFKVLAIRYLIGFFVIIILYYFLAEHQAMQQVLMVCTLLPIGLTIIPFSDELNYDSRIAGTMLNISLLISFGLIWLLVLFINFA
jgi:malate permease and related proteins